MIMPKKDDKYGWWAAPANLHPGEKTPSFKVRWCEVCCSAWEVESIGYKRKKKIIRYEDFPKNSLKHIICDDCKSTYITRRKADASINNINDSDRSTKESTRTLQRGRE
jgi:hypothetical protein